ncbi:MAG: efflux RND transporter permease subunit [Deltaproteobacteria bacterium]|nr:efflux RND transporter permease subunit [Deltaproteobacteria bacterium]
MIRAIIELSARHRFVVLALVFAAFVASLEAMSRVQLDAIPDLTDPQVIVFTEWMGKSPTLIEDQVTYPIVSSLVSAPGVVDVRGLSMFGMSFVYVIFDESVDIYWARSRVLEYLSQLGKRLPEGATPELGPDATGVGWVFQYYLHDSSRTRGLHELRTIQDTSIRYALGSVPGVAEVASIGGFEQQYQIILKPDRMRALDVTAAEVLGSVKGASQEVGARVLEIAGRETYVRGRGYVKRVEDLEEVVVRIDRAVAPVRLRDVASVSLGPEIRRGALDMDGEGEAVGGIVVMRHGGNALAVIEAVKAKIEEISVSLPDGVEIRTAYDRSSLIRRSIATLERALIEEGIVVSLVILLFLLHFRSSLLPILSIPLAVSLAFIPMAFFGIPSTIMSLGGIAIAIGATVDAEIVMIEAAHKKLEHAPPNADRKQLLSEAAQEVTPAIFFSLLIIALSFLPVFALDGQAGRLMKPLAYTKTFVMLSSAILSITFAPALRDILIRGRIRSEKEHPISRLIHRVYEPFVYVALRKPKSTIAIGLFAVISAVPLANRLGHEFMPELDEGDMLYMPITLPGISMEEAKRQLAVQDKVLRSFPEVLTVFGKVGRAESATDPAPLTMVETTVQLKPKEEWRKIRTARWYSDFAPEWLKPAFGELWPEERPLSFSELSAEMHDAMRFPGWTGAWTMPIKTRMDMLTTGVRTPVGIKILSGDLARVEEVGRALEPILREIPGTRSVLYERNEGATYLDITPDRASLAEAGVGVSELLELVETTVGGAPAGETVDGRARYSILVRYPPAFRADPNAIARIEVPVSSGRATGDELPTGGSSGMGGGMGAARVPAAEAAPTPTRRGFVPLGALAQIELRDGPPMIRDENGQLVGYVFIDVDGSRDVGGYVDEAKQKLRDAVSAKRLSIPEGTHLEWTGQYELLERMRERMKILVPGVLFLVALLLYFQFRSVIEVLIVLLSIPFALVGSVWLMWFLNYRISTAVWVGVLALVGLAAQTGVVMIVYIDHAFERRKKAGKIRNLDDIIWAHMEGTVLRVRPKLMTVSTMLVGLTPLLWATGSGADVMKRIAAPMVGGLLTSAFLTLEIIPVVYTYWRYEELLFERLELEAPLLRRRLELIARVLVVALVGVAGLAISTLYVDWPPTRVVWGMSGFGGLALIAGLSYVISRGPAKRAAFGASGAGVAT